MGRLEKTVMIVVAGLKGSGKATTFCKLFGDNLCDKNTPICISESRKLLTLSDEDNHSNVHLSVVYVPSSNDFDTARQAEENLKRFRNKSELCRSRDSIYPNLIIFTFKASDARLLEADSNFSKNLRLLRESSLFDRYKINVIFVGTYCMELPREKEKFIKYILKVRQIIQDISNDILGTPDVTVVFTENMPFHYDLQREDEGNCYRLPDGQLSPQNILNALFERLGANHDELGLLVTKYYSDRNVPEKYDRPVITREIPIQICSRERNEKNFAVYYLGSGYCPVSEKTTRKLFQSIGTTTVDLSGTAYNFPDFAHVSKLTRISDITHMASMTFITKEEYQREKEHRYGLKSSETLNVKSSQHASNKWLNPASGGQDVNICFLYEYRIAHLKAYNISGNFFDLELLKDIRELPNIYSSRNKRQFALFFEKWGSHFIDEINLGGSISVECSVEAGSVNNAFQITDMLNQVQDYLSNLHRCSMTPSLTELRKISANWFEYTKIHIKGGIPPLIIHLRDLSPTTWRDWIESVDRNPIELENSMRISPTYSISPDNNTANGLKEATSAFLESSCYDESDDSDYCCWNCYCCCSFIFGIWDYCCRCFCWIAEQLR